MELDQVEYSTKSVTLAQHIWMQRVQKNADFESILLLILARTNISEEQALALQDDELSIVVDKLTQGIIASTVLQSLGKGFSDA